MKKGLTFLIAAMTAFGAMANLHLTTPSTSLLLDAEPGSELRILYYGDRLSRSDADALPQSLAINLPAYPAYGLTPQRPATIAVSHADGNMTLDMRVTGVKSTAQPDGATLTTVTERDRVYPVEVDINYLTRPDADVIETWTEIRNLGKKTIDLRRFASAYLPVRYGDTWISTLHGSWADEANVVEEPLTRGSRSISDADGVKNAAGAHPEVMISLDGRPRENSGRTIGAVLCYSGNYRLNFDSDPDKYHHFIAEIDPMHQNYRLDKGQSMTTPSLALSYSPEGLSGVSRNFHRWARRHKIAGGTDLRDILLNSWEGVYFDINEEGMNRMMADIAAMGGELFVMDDGWFGDKYPRNNDRQGLGDWVVDKRKLPAGLNGLIDSARSHGIKFGIWLEPEMVDKKSEIFERHPDWILKAAGRDTVFGRGNSQLVLDLGNPAVQDFVVYTVDTLLTRYPEIAYIKWDANMSVLEHGSQWQKSDRQSHTLMDYHRGLENALRRIREKHPDVVMQACASGGARVNYGLLPYFNEVWTSDDTDARQRVNIQWGTSYFFPSGIMGSHISASPNHQTGRRLPLKYRIDVAMSGRLGLELQPSAMTDEERDRCARAISEYKEIRPIVQQGDIYRLLAPNEGKDAAALMHVAPGRDKAVYFWWKTNERYAEKLPRPAMAGLDPDKKYRVRELDRWRPEPLDYEGKVFTGRYLMSNGLEMPQPGYGAILGDNSSLVLLLESL